MKKNLENRLDIGGKDQNKGQITIFIVIGLVFLIVFAAVFFIYNLVTERGEEEIAPIIEATQDVQIVKNFVESCLKDTATDGIYLAGLQGGFVKDPQNELRLLTENNLIGIGVQKNEIIEKQIALYVNDTIGLCFNDFIDFPALTIIEEGQRSVEVSIGKNQTTVILTYPLKLVKDNKESKVDKFSEAVSIRFGHVLDIARQIDSDKSENIDFNFLTKFDTYNTAFPYNSDTIIYSIFDSESIDLKRNKEFAFIFAKKVNVNSAPKLEYISDFVLSKFVPFSYKVEASDPNNDIIEFYENSDLFEINKFTGEILFVPTKEGTFFVKIGVKDNKGLASEQEVRFVIENG